MSPSERIVMSCLHGGFLSVLIAWHEVVLSKVGILHWESLMLIASILWAIAAGVFLWSRRASILQVEHVPLIPPWYYLLLAVPLCIYASLMPWALLQILGLIISVPPTAA